MLCLLPGRFSYVRGPILDKKYWALTPISLVTKLIGS
jgi:hypothetical protein